MRLSRIAPSLVCIGLLAACSDNVTPSNRDGGVDARPGDALTTDVSPTDATGTDAPAPMDAPSDARPEASLPDANDASRDAASAAARACLACTSDTDCGSGAKCVPLEGGRRACLPLCDRDVPVCPGALRCVLDLALSSETLCAPVGTTCCIDADSDGYGTGVACRGPDCDDNDRGRNGGATEACNGIDDNCSGVVDEGCACEPGSTEPCFAGPASVVGVGPCRAGTRTCSASGSFGACTGQVLPVSSELCENDVDDNCNGTVDEGCDEACSPGLTRSCYSGAPSTSGVGRCRAGMQTCNAARMFSPCAGEVLPAASETCGNAVDDNCNGAVDEGCMSMPTSCTTPTVESSSGTYIVLANYEGGRAVLDIDAPVNDIGVVSYDPVQLEVRGSFASSVRRVHLLGHSAEMSTVTGVPATAAVVRGSPVVTLTDPDGYPRVLCGSVCAPDRRPGGCNTLAQILDYFQTTFGGTRRWWHLQYGDFNGDGFAANRGGCCR